MNDSAEKPFEPTARRLARARREGNVARSSELSATCSFAAAGLSVVAIAPLVAAAAVRVLTRAGAQLGADPASLCILVIALVPVAAASLAGTVAGIVQNGGLTPIAVVPKLERLNPIEGLKRIASRETLAHSGRAAVAFACVAMAMLAAMSSSAQALVRAATLAESTNSAWNAAQQVVAAAAGIGLFFSILEYGAARGSWLRKLRMSFEERKREIKEDEGDAATRGRRRALHRAFLRGGLNRVKAAAFVVANPEHVAVALEYRPPHVPVPRVLVRAADAAARNLRNVAERHRVPVVENVALARALYRDVRAGDPIPPAHYIAVAEVVVALSRARELAG